MTDQNELSERAIRLLRLMREDSRISQSWDRDIQLLLDLANLGYAAHWSRYNDVPTQHKFAITKAGRDYLAELDKSEQPEQTRMEQFAEDYPEINGFLRGLPAGENLDITASIRMLTDIVNNITPESQVRQDLRDAQDLAIYFQEQCQRQANVIHKDAEVWKATVKIMGLRS